MNIFFRYGMGKEKKLFVESKDKFSGIAVPLHIALDQNESLPEWLAINQINYFIDPITYVFSEIKAKKHNKDGNLRRSYKKYIDAMNLGHINFIRESLKVDYFKTDKNFDDIKISKFVDRYLRIQIDLRNLDSKRDQETKEFIEFFKNQGIDYPLDIALKGGHNPLFYVSPGFFFDKVGDDWFKLNIHLMKETRKQLPDQRVFGYLLIGRQLLEKQINIPELLQFIPNDLNGIVVWFEDFEEEISSEDELRNVAKLIKGLVEKGFEVINLYGGIFSSLLPGTGNSGYSSGLCYDTHKSREIESGGGPIPFRYYMPEINRFMRQSDAESFYRHINPKCECVVCKAHKDKSIKNGEFIIEKFIDSYFKYDETKEKDYANHEEALKNHFINCSKIELDKVQKNGPKNFINEKKKTYDLLVEKLGKNIAEQYASHIPKWKKILDELM